MAESPSLPANSAPAVGWGYAPTAWGIATGEYRRVNEPMGPVEVRRGRAQNATSLMSRIAGVISGPPPAMGAGHPAGTADTLQQGDVVLVRVSASHAQVEQALPLYAGTGTSAAPVPASSPGHWAQLYAAGRP